MVRSRTAGVIAVVSTLCLALSALGGCAEDSGPAGSDEGGPVRIGAVLDITGAGASLGVPERKTQEQHTKRHKDSDGIGGRKIELTVEDDQSTEDGAAKAMNAVLAKKVDIVIGASRTGPSLAMRPVAESSKTPMLSLAANLKIIDGATWVFKTAQNDSAVLANVIDYLKARNLHTVGLMRDSSSFGDNVAETLTDLGKNQGISLARVEKFAPDAQDFTAQLINLRNAHADVNFIWGIPPAAALAQKAYKQLGVTAPLIQSHGIGTQAFLDTAGASANGLIAPMGRLLVADQLPDSDPQKKVLNDFVADYKNTYGDSPSTFAGHAFDAFHLAVDAVKAAGTDKQKIRDHLEGVKGFVGVTGVFTMTPQDHSGLGKSALVLVTVNNGKWQLLQGN